MSKAEIRERLDRYTDLLAEIRIEERRAKALEDDGSVIQRRARAGICDNLNKLLDQEQKEYEALIKIINQLPRVEQRQVLLARYMDGQGWQAITAAIFGDRCDFDEKAQSYLRRVHRIHGNALANANKIMLQPALQR
jgi:hypothetical protein